MVKRYKLEMDAPQAVVIGTGGLAHVIANQTDVFNFVDKDLTLHGLRLIHELNREQSPATAKTKDKS